MTLPDTPCQPAVVVVVVVALWCRVTVRVAALALTAWPIDVDDSFLLLVWPLVFVFGLESIDVYATVWFESIVNLDAGLSSGPWLLTVPLTVAYAAAAVLVTRRARRASAVATAVLLVSVLTGLALLALNLATDDGLMSEAFLPVLAVVGPGVSLLLLGLLRTRPARGFLCGAVPADGGQPDAPRSSPHRESDDAVAMIGCALIKQMCAARRVAEGSAVTHRCRCGGIQRVGGDASDQPIGCRLGRHRSAPAAQATNRKAGAGAAGRGGPRPSQRAHRGAQAHLRGQL